MTKKDHLDDVDRSPRLVKINFRLSADDRQKGVESENLWAESLDEDRFRLDSIPFYAYGVSLADVVVADVVDGQFQFRNVALRGGHSTYRILVKDPSGYESQGFQQAWREIEPLNCRYEVAKRRWIAIDVPPTSDVFAVYRLLEKGEAAGTWTFEEAHCGHAV